MKNYLKLTNFEFNRFSKIFGALLGITVISQLAGIIMKSREYTGEIQRLMYEERLSQSAALEQMGSFSMLNVVRGLFFNGPIALCIATLLLYMFFIWYRDWLGKNTFIYRLLMLPVDRITLFFSKLTVVFASVLGLVTTQLLMLAAGSQLIKWLVPSAYRLDLSIKAITSASNFLIVLVPSSLINFFNTYGIGLVFLMVMFTAVLMERSFRIPGLILGIVYSVVCGYIFILPLMLPVYLRREIFYPSESYLLMVGIGILIGSLSIFISRYLLNKKVTV